MWAKPNVEGVQSLWWWQDGRPLRRYRRRWIVERTSPLRRPAEVNLLETTLATVKGPALGRRRAATQDRMKPVLVLPPRQG